MPVSSLSFSNVAAGFRRYTAVLHGQLHEEYGRKIPPEQIVGKTRTAIRLSKISGPRFSGFIQNQLYSIFLLADYYHLIVSLTNYLILLKHKKLILKFLQKF